MGERKWTLTKTTTERDRERNDGKGNYWKIGYESRGFSDFAEAREAFRALARECATAKGNTFDGDGNVRGLQELFDAIEENRREQMRDPKPNHMLGAMILRGAPEAAIMAGDYEAARGVPAALRAWLLDMGAYDTNPLPEFRWTNWCEAVVSKPGSLAMGTLCDIDRIETYDAQIYVDAFDMSDPDRPYEFSVRPYFDVYDDEACSLRICLAPGEPDAPGRFVWPEEQQYWPAVELSASPCLEGLIDGNFHIGVGARPRASATAEERSRIAGGYDGFLEGIAALARERGLAVDVDARAIRVTDIHCYKATGDGPWFEIRIQAHFGGGPREREDPPVEVGIVRFEDYGEALSEVGWLLDEYIAGNVEPGEDAWRYQERHGHAAAR